MLIYSNRHSRSAFSWAVLPLYVQMHRIYSKVNCKVPVPPTEHRRTVSTLNAQILPSDEASVVIVPIHAEAQPFQRGDGLGLECKTYWQRLWRRSFAWQPRLFSYQHKHLPLMVKNKVITWNCRTIINRIPELVHAIRYVDLWPILSHDWFAFILSVWLKTRVHTNPYTCTWSKVGPKASYVAFFLLKVQTNRNSFSILRLTLFRHVYISEI